MEETDLWTDKKSVIGEYHGYDGADNIENVTLGFVQQWDLTKYRYLGRKFDWVLALDVAHYIPPGDWLRQIAIWLIVEPYTSRNAGSQTPYGKINFLTSNPKYSFLEYRVGQKII